MSRWFRDDVAIHRLQHNRTPEYGAPECADRTKLTRADPSIDTFSLGAVLLELINLLADGTRKTFRSARGSSSRKPQNLNLVVGRNGQSTWHKYSFVGKDSKIWEYFDKLMEKDKGTDCDPICPIFLKIVKPMLSKEPASRPQVAEVHSQLLAIQSWNGTCCTETTPIVDETDFDSSSSSDEDTDDEEAEHRELGADSNSWRNLAVAFQQESQKYHREPCASSFPQQGASGKSASQRSS